MDSPDSQQKLNEFEQELVVYLRARYTLIVLVTSEEERVLQTIKKICESPQWSSPCLVWDSADGFKTLTQWSTPLPRPAANERQINDYVLDHVEKIEGREGKIVFILKDFHEYWAQSPVKRKLRNVVQRLKFTQKSIVITSVSRRIPPELVDDALVLDFPLPTTVELENILTSILTPLTENSKIRDKLNPLSREQLVQAALGMTGSQARYAFSKAVVSCGGAFDERSIDLVIKEKAQIIRESEALEYYPVTATVDDVGGLEVLKQWLKLRSKAFTQKAREYGLPTPKGILLIGIPGTGKSLTAKMIASSWHLPLLRLDAGSLFGSLVGQSEERTRRALQLAETISPSILWIDEIEKAINQNSGTLDSGTSARVFGTILTWMQEKTTPCFVVATANNINALPPELLRKGRFDEIFFLDLPTLEERKEIFRVHIHNRRRLPDVDYTIDLLARESQGYVGAEIEQAIIDAMYVGFDDGGREFTNDDILAALKRQIPISRSHHDQIDKVRKWLQDGLALSASLGENRGSSSEALSLQLEIMQ